MKKDKNTLTPINKNTHSVSITNFYTVFEQKNAVDFYFSGECHPQWEMVYVIDGCVGVTADKKIYTLSKGDIIFHKPMEFHKIWNEKSESSHVFICSFDLEGKYIHALRDSIYTLKDDSLKTMEMLLSFLRSQTPSNKESFPEFDYGTLIKNNDTFLQITINYLELVFLYLSYSDKRENQLPSEKMMLYTKIAEILEEKIYDKITISQIAKMCNVSASTLKNCFTEYAGCTIHKYFLNIKIRAAIDLLKSGKNVNEVSDILNFANPNYFSYVFKRETGTSAKIYKK